MRVQLRSTFVRVWFVFESITPGVRCGAMCAPADAHLCESAICRKSFRRTAFPSFIVLEADYPKVRQCRSPCQFPFLIHRLKCETNESINQLASSDFNIGAICPCACSMSGLFCNICR